MNRSSAERSVEEQLLIECEAMAKYAMAQGLKLPAGLMEQLTAQTAGRDLPTAAAEANQEPTEPPAKRLPTRELTQIHNRLSDLVSPATPKTIVLLATEEAKDGAWQFLGAVPLIRRLLLVAILSMVGFVVVSLSDQVNGGPKSFNLLQNNGLPLLLSELFLLSAASIGASFTNLFQAQRYIKEGTFDPKFESTYWVRYVLGLMAGTILALLIPVESLFVPEGDSSGEHIMAQLGKPTLALLGGFSAAAVYRMLTRIVESLESLVKGDAKAAVELQEQLGRSRLAAREVQTRVGLVNKLVQIQEKLSTSDDPAAVREEIRRIQRQIMDPDDDGEEVAAVAPAKASTPPPAASPVTASPAAQA